MTHPPTHDHGPSLNIAHSEVGSVSMCPCGVITVSLQYLSLRFEPAAFAELQVLLAFAQRRLDAGRAGAALQAAAPGDTPPMH